MPTRSPVLILALAASSATGCGALLGLDSWDSAGGVGGSTGAAGGDDGGGGATASIGSGGGSCAEDAECPSANCVDGVCCDGPCDGLCFACSADKTGEADGKCSRVLSDTDPDDDCEMPREDVCGPVPGTCGCFDNQQNGDETEVDCGGPTCPACGQLETACTDGLDDDGDGFVDCDDPDCAVKAKCLPAVPGGWGPGAFYKGALPLPDCPDGFDLMAIDGGVGVSAQAHMCTACACGQPTGAMCDTSDVTAHKTAMCPAGGMTFTVDANSCLDAPSDTDVQSFKATPVPVTGKSCAISGGQVVKQMASFEQHARFCPTTQTSNPAGCADCVPKPPGPFAQSPCILASGDVPCPPGYGQRTDAFQMIADDRDCTSCICVVPGGTCTATVAIYPANGCVSGAVQFAADGACHDVTNIILESVQVIASLPLSNAPCAEAGGMPTGSATGVGPITICCP